MLPDSSDRVAAAEGASEAGGQLRGSPEHVLAAGPSDLHAPNAGRPREDAAPSPASGSRAGPPWRPEDVLTELDKHPRGDDIARLVHAVAFAAADEHRATFSDGLGELAERAGLRREDAETAFGNVLTALERTDGGPA